MQTTEKKTIFILRPAFITATLTLLLIINIVSLLQTGKQTKQGQTVVHSKPATIESFAAAYNMNTLSGYE